MKDRAQVVIIGAGIVGCSVAYHLARLGWRDVIVVDEGPLFETGGSTSHAPGGVFSINFSQMMTRFASYTVDFYSRFAHDGLPAFYPVGSMEVAWTPERWTDLKRKANAARSWGVEAELLDPSQAQQKIPLLTDRILGALLVPTDGIARAVRAAAAMAAETTAEGVEFYGETEVYDISVVDGRVRGIVTSAGPVEAEHVVVATGIWAPRTAGMAGVTVPLVPMQHPYVVTDPLPELAGETAEVRHPVLRHQDQSMYFRQERDAYGIGSYRHEPLPLEPDGIRSHRGPDDQPAIYPFTEDQFGPALEAAGELIPCLRGARLASAFNGVFSFTSDGMPLLGPFPSVEGMWVAAAIWITHAGGVAKSLAEWMVDGEPEWDVHEADISRFEPHALRRDYVQERSVQQYREVYDIIHPTYQVSSPRRLRVSPPYQRQIELGAEFFETAGWERPQRYGANEDLVDEPAPPWARRSGWEAEGWSPAIGVEHLATRERVGIFDLTTFVKLDVAGDGALPFLERIAANRIDRPVGTVIYTSMLTDRGRIKCDLTVTRTGEDRFRVVTGAGVGAHDTAWIRSHLPGDGSVTLADMTSSECCFGVWGPRARDLIESVSDDDFSNDAFPYMTARHVTVANTPALASRISYVGELGWELYVPTEFGLRVWDALWEAGRSLGAVAAGTGAMHSLRVEKGYRLWGQDIGTDYDPYEAGLGFAVKAAKGDFLGREALRQKKESPLRRKLTCMTLDDPSAVVLGREPITANGLTLGFVTSANYGYSVGRGIAYGYLPLEYAEPGTAVKFHFFDRGYAATVATEPLFDSESRRVRS